MTTPPPTSESRLDTLVGALRQHEPTLDEVTRARVGADLASALRNPPPAPTSFLSRLVTAPRRWLSPSASGSSRRWLAGGLTLAAAAAAVVLIRDTSDSRSKSSDRAATGTSPSAVGTSPSAVGTAPSAVGTAPSAVGTAPSATALTAPVLAPGHAVDVAVGSIARVAVADADITVYGPGRIETSDSSSAGAASSGAASSGASGTGARIDAIATVDADAATIDRSHGSGTLALRYDDLEVHVTHATFAFDRKLAPRVTVMRGELLLRCLHSDRTIHAGESASCADGPPTITASLGTPAGTSGPATGRTSDTPAASGTRTARAAATRSAELGGESVARGADDAPTDLYATADDALRRGDRAAARTALEQVVRAQPASTDAAAALLDLARLDATSDPGIALRRLDALDAHPRGASLAEPAAHLRCTMLDDDDHLDCLASFVERFPHSPRTAAALARLATRRAAADCAAAAPLLADYLDRFPRGADAAAVTAWRDRCASDR